MLKNIPYKSIISLVYVIAIMMEIIDVTIINVALPKMQLVLNAPMNLMGWITNGYVLSLATSIPLSTWLGERYGTKKIFIFGIALFTVASILCGFATNIHFLIWTRVLQGIGGGMLVPVGQTILFRAFDPKEIPVLLSKLAIPLTLAPALGQALGGIIVEYLSWHWIFWVNIPFGIFCFWTSRQYLKESESNKYRMDFIGLGICTLAIFFLFYSFSIVDFQSSLEKPLLFFIFSVFLLICFVLFEKRQKSPFFNLNVFAHRNFSLAIISSLLIFSNITGTFFISNFVFQETIGWTPLEAGMLSVPFSVGFLIAIKALPRIYPQKIAAGPLIIIANLTCILASLGMNFVNSKEDFNFLLFLFLARGISFGFLIITLQSVGLSGIKKELMGDASTIVTLTRYAFVGFGTVLFVVLTVVFMKFYGISPVSFSADKNSVIKIFHGLFNVATLCLILAFPFILKMKDETPREEARELVQGEPFLDNELDVRKQRDKE